MQRSFLKKTHFKKAQGIKLLCLSCVAILSFSFVGIAHVQAQDDIYVTGHSNPTAQMEIRLQQMETQIRELTGKTEQQAYELKRLKKKVKSLSMGSPSSAVMPRSAKEKFEQEVAVLKAKKAKEDKSPKPLLNFKPPSPSGMKTAIPGGSLDATATYEQAYAYLKNAQYSEARVEFQKFLERHPDHVLAANAKYWLGETFYVQGDYKKSAKIFAEGFQKFPKSAKSPDILLKLGMSLAKLGKEKDACVALGQLAIKFPTEINPAKKRAEQEMKKLECK